MERRHLRVIEVQSKKGFISWIRELLEKRGAKLQRYQERFLQAYYSRKFKKEDEGKIEVPHFLKARQQVDYIKKIGQVEKYYKEIRRGLIC